ncbi:MAG TPA: ATP-binding protein, partial [Candidatus Deferrimicrobiaceae bacterium]
MRTPPGKHSLSPQAGIPPAVVRTASRFTILFGLLLILAGWAGFAFLTLLDREREIVRVRNENTFAAAALEENARRVIKTADTALLFMKSEYEKTGAVSKGMKQFALMTKTDLQAVQVAISDSRGKLIYSVVPMKNPVSNFNREHFQAQLRRRDAGLYIAKPVKSQVSGAWAFFLSRRIDRPDGSFGGVVSIGIDPFYFAKIYGALGLGEDRSGLVVGTDHIVRVRVSPTETLVGDDISGYSPVFKEAARKAIGYYEVVTVRDKIERMASYRAMPDYPLVVIVSVVKPDVLVDWRNRTLGNAFATFLFTLFVAGSCYFLNRAQRLARKSEEEQALLRERLVQSQKMEAIGTLAGGVAHDFNNMLGVIIGRTELAMRQAGVSGPLRENLEEIGKAAERSADVTRQLLAFARKQPVAPRVLDLNESLESVLRMIRRLIGEEIDLSWNPGRNLWKVKIDPTQVDQMMANLATNARDAITGVGRIVIETSNETLDERQCIDRPGSSPGDYVVLSVSDDGCGISREQIGNIFDPFFTTKAVGRGTGLGLATIYGIVSQNGGFITVYSEPGHGATFRVHLPRVEAGDGEPATEARSSEPAGGSETILLVEDEPANLSLV